MNPRYRTPLMEAASEVPTPVGAPAAVPVVTPSPAAPAPGEEFKNMTPEQFKARIAEAQSAGAAKAYKDLGVKDTSEARARFEELQKLKDAQLSEQERAKKQIDELTPQAARAVKLEQAVKSLLETEEKLIPDDKKSLLDLAPAADQPEARLQWIASAKAKGLFATTAPATDPASAAAAQRAANPATTIAPPGPATPPPTGAKTELQQYEDLKARGMTRLAAQHYERYGTLIEQQRAATKPQ